MDKNQKQKKQSTDIVYQPRYVVLSIIAVLVLSSCAGFVVYWWMQDQIQTVESALQARVQDLNFSVSKLQGQLSEAQEIAPQSANHPVQEISLDTSNIGDSVLALSIASIAPYDSDESEIGVGNARVEFLGKTRITGVLFYSNAQDAACVNNLDAASMARLPYLFGDGRPVWFCIEDPRDDVLDMADAETVVTMDIANYTINWSSESVVNTAIVDSIIVSNGIQE